MKTEKIHYEFVNSQPGNELSYFPCREIWMPGGRQNSKKSATNWLLPMAYTGHSSSGRARIMKCD